MECTGLAECLDGGLMTHRAQPGLCEELQQ